MVQLISRPEYRIEHLPGFEHLVFSESSTEQLSLPQSVSFASERDSVLQSAREAWAFRIDSNGQLESDKYQSTRTAALYLQRGNGYVVAFCDTPDPDENILLSRAQEGYESHRNKGSWLVSLADPVVKRMFEPAQDEHRVVPALDAELILRTGHTGRASPYRTHSVTQAILGEDLAESAATYLRGREYGTGYVWTLSPGRLRELGVDETRGEIRRVGVGGVGNFGSSFDLGAGGLCDGGGWARGVRKSSTGNKG